MYLETYTYTYYKISRSVLTEETKAQFENKKVGMGGRKMLTKLENS